MQSVAPIRRCGSRGALNVDLLGTAGKVNWRRYPHSRTEAWEFIHYSEMDRILETWNRLHISAAVI